jgi:lysophospholipase L1-like esterase
MPLTRDLKEMLRHLISRSGLSRLHLGFRKARGENVEHLFYTSLASRFSAIYANRVWLNARASGSLSGLGSDLATTESIRQRLPELLQSLRTQTLLDIGCGDFTWMKETRLPCRYIGIDIVREIVESNRALWSSETRAFHTLDATVDQWPQADTILCREVLFHLSFGDIWRLLKNAHLSPALVLIATNDNGLRVNADIASGDFRMLNLHKAPFFFPPPELSIPDSGIDPDRVLSVWPIQALPHSPR